MLVALLVVAVAVGVVVALRGGPSGGVPLSRLDLHGAPAQTAVLAVSFGDGGEYTVTGTVDVSFSTGRVAATLTVPTLLSSETFRLFAAGSAVDVNAPVFSSLLTEPWVSVASVPLSLDGLRQWLDHVPLGALAHTLGPATERRTGQTVSYAFAATVGLRAPRHPPIAVPAEAHLAVTVVVGPSGQFIRGRFAYRTPVDFDVLTVRALSYDRAVSITAPQLAKTEALTPALRVRLFGTVHGHINRLLTPAGLRELAAVRARLLTVG